MSPDQTTTPMDGAHNVSVHKVKQHMQRRGLIPADLARALNIGDAAVCRGLKSQTWLDGKIEALAKALSVPPIDLIEHFGPISGSDVLMRVCGASGKTGFRLPEGAEIVVLMLNGRWGTYLVAPAETPVKDGDFVVVTSSDKKGAKVGRLQEDGNGGHRWILIRGGMRGPVSIAKNSIISIRLIISALHGAWGQQ